MARRHVRLFQRWTGTVLRRNAQPVVQMRAEDLNSPEIKDWIRERRFFGAAFFFALLEGFWYGWGKWRNGRWDKELQSNVHISL